MSDVSWVPRIGEEFAGYRLVSLLGHGGMSIVYRAEHSGLGRIVALKLLSPELSGDADFRERFQRESRIAASLEHPNIIPIYEAGEESGVLYIAMRYVDGADLRSRLKRDGPFDNDKTASLISQVAAALEAAHAKNLIHRDVKPANILVASEAGVEGSDHFYLSDFGVAKSTASAGLTRTGLFVGTADYAAPEQIEGKPLDGRADVYALGCVAYEALTANPAYDKDSEVSMMYAHLLEPAPKVTERRPDLPPEVDEAIGKAMAKSRDDRFSRPTEFAVALKKALALAPRHDAEQAPAGGRETVLAARPPMAGSASTKEAAQRSPPPSGEAGGGSRRPGRGILIGVAVAVVAGIAILLGVLLTGGKSGSPKSGAPAILPATTTTTAPGGGGTAANLMAVLMPTQIAKECKTQPDPAAGALETEDCVSPPTARVSDPNEFSFSFYPGSDALLQAYQGMLTQAHGEVGQNKPLAKCGSSPPGPQFWVHSTGKLGGRRFCFTDSKGNYVIVWTHEKRGSDDHVDMLGIAREPGRAPTIFASWWLSVKDFIGKCRPEVSQELCLNTIKKVTGEP